MMVDRRTVLFGGAAVVVTAGVAEGLADGLRRRQPRLLSSPVASPSSRGTLNIAWHESFSLRSFADNWPCTELRGVPGRRDGELFTFGCDGTGFDPRAPMRSMTGAVVTGRPWTPTGFPWGDLSGRNLTRCGLDSGGANRSGEKASGLLAHGGVIYAWVRNVTVAGDYRHSQLCWSRDGGSTWSRASWLFSTSFGCPDFVQGSPDRTYAYVASQNNNDAYKVAGGVVLARVPLGRIADRGAYEFRTRSGWSPRLGARAEVLSSGLGVYRVGMTFNPWSGKYLLTSSHGGGSLDVWASATPYGPWAVAYSDEFWSTGRTYEQHIPAAYQRGSEVWILYAGQAGAPYKFTLRRGVLS